MKQEYPASDAQRNVLNFAPTPSQCLPTKDVSTIRVLVDSVVYLWLSDGCGCWYHVDHSERDSLLGWCYRDGWWHRKPVEIERIARYY